MITNPSDNRRSGSQWELPPLILHPFTHGTDTTRLAESVRLTLYTSGLAEFAAAEDPDASLLEGRYCEFRMLCFVGKDLMRWIRQCADFAARDEALAGTGIREQSFSDLLVNHTPATVAARFEAWGVVDYRRILHRGIGLNSLFPYPPDFQVISTDFLVHYYAYADALFACFQSLTEYTRLQPDHFSFSVYTSTEYAHIIESESPQEPGLDTDQQPD